MAEESVNQNPPLETQVQNQENSPQQGSLSQATQTTSPPNPSEPKIKSGDKGLLKKIVIILILLVVIAGVIIFGQRYYKSWQLKQRDSQRKTDIQSLQKGLEAIRPKTQDQKYYPGDITESTMVKTGVMSKIPKDPINKPPYTYIYQGRPVGCTATCTGYILFACLENTKDAEGKSPLGACQTKIYEVTK